MKRRHWSQDEDNLVCEFYLWVKEAKKADFDKLHQLFVDKGFERSWKSIRARYLNYKYIDLQPGLSHYNKQQEET